MNDDQIKHMANRFLSWELPTDFTPDGGITFTRFGNFGIMHQYENHPTGTNLLAYTQALSMVNYLVEGLPVATSHNDKQGIGQMNGEGVQLIGAAGGTYPYSYVDLAIVSSTEKVVRYVPETPLNLLVEQVVRTADNFVGCHIARSDSIFACMGYELKEAVVALRAYRESQKPKSALDIAKEALTKLSCLGNGDRPGNSIGNEIAQDALRHIATLQDKAPL